MTFQEFLEGREAIGIPVKPEDLRYIKDAWDAALCSASAACFESGKLREASQIQPRISQLHTWKNHDQPS